MIVHRTDKTKGKFTQVDNAVILDTRLSLKARGLMTVLLSLAPGWKLSLKGLKTLISHDGRESIQSAFNELKDLGYVVCKSARDAGGRIQPSEYVVYEASIGDLAQNVSVLPQTAFPDTVIPDTDIPATGNPPLCNTETSNTETNKDIDMELESTSNSTSHKKETEKDTGPVASATDVVGQNTLKDFAAKADSAMVKNMEMASSRYWNTLGDNIKKGQTFSQAFGSQTGIAWTTTEYGYLREIAEFCINQWPQSDPLCSTESLVREAFRHSGKAHQFLRYFVQHNNRKVSLRPYLTLAGGRQDPLKRNDILVELASRITVGKSGCATLPPSQEQAFSKSPGAPFPAP